MAQKPTFAKAKRPSALSVRALEHALQTIKSQYAAYPDRDAHKDRTAAFLTVLELLKFIDDVPEWRRADLGFALRPLLLSLNDVTQGLQAPMFEPMRSEGDTRPPPPQSCQQMQGQCAAAVEILMRSGEHSKEASCRKVFDWLGPKAVAWVRGAQYMKHRDPMRRRTEPG